MARTPSRLGAKDSFIQSIRKLVLPATVVVVALLYAAPYVVTAARGESSKIPPLFGPDLYFYLNISRLHASTADSLVNPWYGVEVPLSALAYWKFRSGFIAFNIVRNLLGGNWPLTLVLWSAGWAVLIACGTLYVLDKILPRSSLLLAVGVAFLLLFDVTLLPASASAWMHVSLDGFRLVRLPYTRTFFPQVAIPFLLLYVGLQIEALRAHKRYAWALMALIQWAAFTCFPYTTLLMAGTTACVVALAWIARRLDLSWREILGFALACGVLDGAYLLLSGASHAAAAVAVREPILSISLARLPYILRGHAKMLAMLAAATIGCAIVPDDERRESKGVLVSLGVANLLLYFADLFVSPMLQVTDHDLYFVHTVLGLLVIYLAGAAVRVARERRLRAAWVLTPVLLLIMVHGALAAAGGYRKYVSFNRASAATAKLFSSLQLGPRDIVLSAADSVDDVSCWLPLISEGRLVYCSNAELALSPANKAEFQRYRQAVYLYFSGRDSASVDTILARPDEDAKPAQWLFAQVRERLLLAGPERRAALASMRETLVPVLRRLESGDGEALNLFAAYDRVIIVDNVASPTFAPDRLRRYLQVVRETDIGRLRVRWCRARPSL